MIKPAFFFRPRSIEQWSAIDGDTVRVVADAGDYDYKHRVLRLAGIDAPELRSVNDLERRAANVVRDWVNTWLRTIATSTDNVFIESRVKPDMFGRWVGDISADAAYLTSALLTAGMVRRYDGARRLPWSDAELQAIIDKSIIQEIP